jgi:hypothetical protein
MNEIPTQSGQITSDIIKFTQSKHGSLCNPKIPVYDCERKTSFNKPIPSDQNQHSTQSHSSSALADLQSDQLPVAQPESCCEVCMINPSDSILHPCGHLGICSTCANFLIRNGQNCPFCRQPIRTTQRAYRP